MPEGEDDINCLSLVPPSSQITLYCVSLFGVEEVIDTGMKRNLGTVGRNDWALKQLLAVPEPS